MDLSQSAIAALSSYYSNVQRKIIGAASLLTLSGILIAGLWPFHSPKNEVYWLGNRDGLRFGHHGTILSSGQLKFASLDGSSCSFEIWLTPALTWKTATVFAFYSSLSHRQFSFQQSDTDLVLRREIGDGYHQSSLDVNEVFQKDKQVFITVTSDGQGMAVYIDGKLAARSLRFGLSTEDFKATLIVATSPLQSNSWPGMVRGIAIYNSDLNAAEVFRHHQEWTQKGKPIIDDNERALALYLFDERAGNIVYNHLRSGDDLNLPERYMVVHQLLLERPWKEFITHKSYMQDALINICGFVPLGFFFAAYFTSVRQMQRAIFATIVLGALVSLAIEVIQAYLPTRDSGVTDLITNTFGTGVGVALYHAAALPLARVLGPIR